MIDKFSGLVKVTKQEVLTSVNNYKVVDSYMKTFMERRKWEYRRDMGRVEKGFLFWKRELTETEVLWLYCDWMSGQYYNPDEKLAKEGYYDTLLDLNLVSKWGSFLWTEEYKTLAALSGTGTDIFVTPYQARFISKFTDTENIVSALVEGIGATRLVNQNGNQSSNQNS